MFFCINLVFATSTNSNARVIIGNEEADITINVNEHEYVLTNAVIDPLTKGNLITYIFKEEDVPISFNLPNTKMLPDKTILKIFYYRQIKNKNIKVRCLDKVYKSGTNINLMPINIYNILKATNRLYNSIIIYQFDYVLYENDEESNKTMQFAFKIVSEKEFDMYKEIGINAKPKAVEETILRPKKVK